MKVCLWSMGAASDKWVFAGEEVYQKRIERYLPFEFRCMQPVKSKSRPQVLEGEAKWILQQLENTPTKLVVLDEKGQQWPSVQFARHLENWRQGNYKRLVFLIGSAYGFDPRVYERANEIMSVSMMTMPHQLCRLFMLEQIYRACTILKGESYHHE